MALYNNGYPATYQQYYPQFQQIQPVQPQNNVQNQQSGLNWIQGEQAAKSYLIAPNSTVVLFDSERDTLYIKSADASGMPSMKILDYTIRETGKSAPNSASMVQADHLSGYATKDDIEAVSDQIKALRERVDQLTKRRANDE